MLDARRRLPVSSKTLEAYNIGSVTVNESRSACLWKMQRGIGIISLGYRSLREEAHNFLPPDALSAPHKRDMTRLHPVLFEILLVILLGPIERRRHDDLRHNGPFEDAGLLKR